ncbi:MAG: hypothetical protein ACE5OW_07395 [Candidatus Bathyarchaeia archaeon]
MGKAEKKRRKKRLKQLTALEEEEKESRVLLELVEVLEDLEEEGKLVDIQICPRCKSPRVRRVNALTGDMSGHLALTPPKYECLECGWRERLVLKATNRLLGLKEVAIIAEASGLKEREA